MRTLLILAPLVLLAGCGGSGPPKVDNTPEGAADFSGPLFARGADPAWSVTVRGTQLVVTRPGQPDLVAQAPGAVIQPDQASWTGQIATGGSLKVVFYNSPCPDASDTQRPFTAEADLPDGRVLAGCGYRIKK